MQEFWFCSRCSSMNWATARQCYKCRAVREQATLARVQERRLEDVAMPGVDKLDPGHAVALAQGSYVTTWLLGRLSTVPIFLAGIFTLGLVLGDLALLMPLARSGTYDLGSTGFVLILASSTGLGISSVASIVLSGIYLGLLDRNVSSLGGGTPRFGPWRAAAWWIESWLWFMRAWLLVYGPLWFGLWVMSNVSSIVGLLLIVPLYVGGYALLGSPMYALRKPARLLEDLLRRLSLSGSGDSPLAAMWSGAWMSARLIVLLYPFIFLGIDLLAVLVLAARLQPDVANFVDPQGVAVLLVGAFFLVIGVALAADAVAFFLLGRITLSLCSSERDRRRWVLAGAGGGGPGPSGPRYPALRSMPAQEYAGSAVSRPGSTPVAGSVPGPEPTAYPAGAPQPGLAPAPPAGSMAEVAAAPAAIAGFVPPPRSLDERGALSRRAERIAPEPDLAPRPAERMPIARRRAIQQTGASADRQTGGAAAPPPTDASPEVSPPDVPEPAGTVEKRVIQPSSSTVPRYRRPAGRGEPGQPAESTPHDIDVGGGI